ncbi:MCE family protein [Mycolicibacterium sp. 018/SC-01/001]|uniref:MCE family protein n=1 Tax=Mycolicibacterium sp. 018/SC-01/001 TaxID=2592069 RepID=UPI00117C5B34|nr:MCE family protein [Mycolicibacterium sp. 018/SC-01/001]TRW80235.1 MCE family protein [Mycolicibacterium sp. 018/SC-01/001]
MTGTRGPAVKFAVFVTVMALLTAVLVVILGNYRSGSTNTYSALFANVSRLKTGDSVRVAGVRVGTVDSVTLRDDKLVDVTFDADRSVALTTGTIAQVRYLNLIGDRYLELVDTPDSTRLLPMGAQIPVERTRPALDLDFLLGGLRPLTQGLRAEDINTVTSALLQALQGQGGTLESLFRNTAVFTKAIADRGQVVQQLVDNLRQFIAVLKKDGTQLGSTIDGLEQLITGLSQDRDPIGTAIDSLDAGTASVADLLTQARPPLAQNVDQLSRLAPILTDGQDKLEAALVRAPSNYKKLVRLGAYGSWINYYICGLSVRVTDLQGRTAVFPWVKNQGGRCVD